MFGINKNGTKHKVGIIMPAFFPASRTTFDNTTSGLSANRAQGAIDELCTRVNTKVSDEPTFTEASTRANIASGESFAIILGKIKKFFTDLKTVAFTGSYSDLSNKPIYYGTCTSQAANQIKAVTIDAGQGFALTTGAIIFVKFDANNTYSATADAPVKLNVNSTGAINIYYAGSNAPTGTNTTAFGRTNYVNQYYYDGTNWIWSGSSADNNTTYSNMSASELTTGTATTARSISAKVLTDWLVAKLTNVAYKNINNAFSAEQAVDQKNGTTSSLGVSALVLGNNIPAGTDKNSLGQLTVFSNTSKAALLQASRDMQSDVIVKLPSKGGTTALTSDFAWNLLGRYDIADTSSHQITTIPSTANEIMCVVGSKNNTQVYGGKSFVLPATEKGYSIISTGELISGSGTVVSTKGVYLNWNSNNTLEYRAFDYSATLLLRVYYR